MVTVCCTGCCVGGVMRGAAAAAPAVHQWQQFWVAVLLGGMVVCKVLACIAAPRVHKSFWGKNEHVRRWQCCAACLKLGVCCWFDVRTGQGTYTVVQGVITSICPPHAG